MAEVFKLSEDSIKLLTDSISKSLPREAPQQNKISNNSLKLVSDYRRAQLEADLEKPSGLSAASYVYPAFKKTAATDSTSSGWRGSGGTTRQSPEIYSPLWIGSNLNLPRDRATINAWSRAYFATNGLVQNAIQLHSTYPISKLTIKCKDKKQEQFFSEMIEEIDLMNICCQIAQEYWVLGEAFVYAQLGAGKTKWSRLIIQNPDYIEMQNSVIPGDPVISLKPDEHLKRIITSNKPSDILQRQKMDPYIAYYVKKGQNIPLNNFNITHIARKLNPYELRGTGLIVSVFRQLMLFDQLRESKFAQAANMINPLTLIKIGGGTGEYKPSPADLQQWRELFENAQYDKDFKIITHDGVTVDRVGANAGVMDISGDITQLIKEIYMGLMVPSVLMDGGADTTYSNGSVALDVLKQRYQYLRNYLSWFLRKKIFAPISQINEFYEYEDGKQTLQVPEIDWNHMSLFDMGDYVQGLKELTTDQDKRVSLHTLYRSMGLDWEDEKRKIREEAIEKAILEKEMESLKKMSLNELRALGPNDEIQEPEEGLLPGEQPSQEEQQQPSALV